MTKEYAEPQKKPASEYRGSPTVVSQQKPSYRKAVKAREKFTRENKARFENVRTPKERLTTEAVEKVQAQKPFKRDYDTEEAYDTAMSVYFEKLRRAAGVRPKRSTSLKSGGQAKDEQEKKDMLKETKRDQRKLVREMKKELTPRERADLRKKGRGMRSARQVGIGEYDPDKKTRILTKEEREAKKAKMTDALARRKARLASRREARKVSSMGLQAGGKVYASSTRTANYTAG